jgi:cysteine desulfurase/selenocysteine lyase
MEEAEVAALRHDTPGAAAVMHFNNAGCALPPRPVVDTVIAHLRREAEIGGYEAAGEAQARLNAVYASIARLLGCAPDEIAVVENATRAWDMAFYALPLGPGDRILTAMAEYASNYIAFLQLSRRRGVQVEVVPNDASGQLDVSALERMIDRRVKLIAVTHVPTNGGLVNPAAAIGRVARSHGIPFLLDTCQAAGQLPLDVEAIGCDMLSATGRKYLRGPRGTGFLYVRRELIDRLEPPFLDLHAAEWTSRDDFTIRGDARRFENWECNVAAKLGLGAAVDYALALGVDRIHGRVAFLAEQLRQRLRDLPNVQVQDLGTTRCGIVSFTVQGRSPAAVSSALAAQRINLSVSGRGSTLLDMEGRGLTELLRASLHYYNTEVEITRFCAVLTELTA